MIRQTLIALVSIGFLLNACGGDIKVNDGTHNDGVIGDPRGLFAINSTNKIQSPNSPYGLWESDEINSGGNVTTQYRILIKPESTTKATLCRFPGGVNVLEIVAQVSAGSEINQGRWVVLESQEDVKYLATAGATFECRSNLFSTTAEQSPKLNIVDGKMRMGGAAAQVYRKVGN